MTHNSCQCKALTTATSSQLNSMRTIQSCPLQIMKPQIYSIPHMREVLHTVCCSIICLLGQHDWAIIQIPIEITCHPLAIAGSHHSLPASAQLLSCPPAIFAIRIAIYLQFGVASVLLVVYSSRSEIIHILQYMRISKVHNHTTFVIMWHILSPSSVWRNKVLNKPH